MVYEGLLLEYNAIRIRRPSVMYACYSRMLRKIIKHSEFGKDFAGVLDLFMLYVMRVQFINQYCARCFRINFIARYTEVPH